MKVKATMIVGTIVASVWLGTLSDGFAGGGQDLLIGGQTAYEKIQYDPSVNLLTIVGGQGDDWLEVVLAKDGGVFLNGISLAKLGIRLQGVPVVAMYGGGGNDVLIARRFPLAALNGGTGKDVLVWDNSDRAFERATNGEDVLLSNT